MHDFFEEEEEYECPECGHIMINEGGDPDYLVCENCGYSVNAYDEDNLDEDEFERMYPLPPDYDEEDDDDGEEEYYDEVCNELED